MELLFKFLPFLLALGFLASSLLSSLQGKVFSIFLGVITFLFLVFGRFRSRSFLFLDPRIVQIIVLCFFFLLILFLLVHKFFPGVIASFFQMLSSFLSHYSSTFHLAHYSLFESFPWYKKLVNFLQSSFPQHTEKRFFRRLAKLFVISPFLIINGVLFWEASQGYLYFFFYSLIFLIFSQGFMLWCTLFRSLWWSVYVHYCHRIFFPLTLPSSLEFILPVFAKDPKDLTFQELIIFVNPNQTLQILSEAYKDPKIAFYFESFSVEEFYFEMHELFFTISHALRSSEYISLLFKRSFICTLLNFILAYSIFLVGYYDLPVVSFGYEISKGIKNGIII